jgi:hypothetical protein
MISRAGQTKQGPAEAHRAFSFSKGRDALTG